MYSIHGLLVSETDFAYYIPLYNASHFLDSVKEGGLPLWVSE